MTPRERMNNAMRMLNTDRIPVMCQLSMGHYFLYSGINPMDIWFTSEGFAEAIIRLREKYSFDGVLINLPGRERDYKKYIHHIEDNSEGKFIYWHNGNYTTLPFDHNPHYYQKDGRRISLHLKRLPPIIYFMLNHGI